MNFSLDRILKIFLLVFLFIAGLVYAKPFLVPIAFATLLAMLFIPLSGRMESKGFPRALAALICVLIFLSALAGVLALLSWQFSDLAENITQLENQMREMWRQLQQFIKSTFGISADKQDEMMQQQGSSLAEKIIAAVPGIITNILVKVVLTTVYLFILIYYRSHIKNFLLKLFPSGTENQGQIIISKSSNVAFQYLWGMAQMIVGLWIMYSIGFTISGLDNPVFFAMFVGSLEIVPFVGNITGTTLAILFALSQGGGAGMITGIILTYGIVQFIQSYILEPLVVGHEVRINPMAIILVLVAGEMIWGIPGLVLSIPFMGMVKIFCDHVDALKPFAFLIGDNQRKKESIIKKMFEKIRSFFVPKK